MKSLRFVLLVVLVWCFPFVAGAAVQEMVAPVTIVHGTTVIQFSWTLDDSTGEMLFVQEVVTQDSTKYWRSITRIMPDTDGDNEPEVTLLEYAPPTDPMPHDANGDGVVNIKDFWVIYRHVFRLFQ